MKTPHYHIFSLKTFSIFAACMFAIASLSAAGLSGSYTINPKLAPSASNYISFNDADSDLVFGARSNAGTANGPGVTAAVTFSVADGVYNEGLIIPLISGVSASSMITFQSASKDSTKVTLRNNVIAPTGYLSYVLVLNGAQFINFNQMTFKRDSTKSFDDEVVILEYADSNTFSNCRFMADANHAAYLGVSGSLVFAPSGGPTGTITDNYNTFYNNNFSNADYAFYWSPSTSGSAGNVFDHNMMDNIGVEAFVCYYETDLTVTNNKINMPWGGYGIDINTLNNSTYTPTMASMIANNFVSIADNPQAGGYNIGISVLNVDSTYLADNNVNIYGTASISTALQVSSAAATTNMFVYNNNLININSGANGYGAYLFNLTDENNDNVRTNGNTTVAYNGTGYASVAAWKSSGVGFGGNDLGVDPIYFSKTDLHIKNPKLNGAAVPVPGITTDIDGDKRNTGSPDIGADEISPAADLPAITAITNPGTGYCAGSVDVYVTLSNYGYNTLTTATIEWSVNGTAQTAFSWVGSLNSGSSTSVKVGTYSLSSGSYKIVSYPSAGNASSFTSTTSNTTTINSIPGLSGSYTINPSGAGSTNYKTFHSAVNDLNNGGLCGAVTFAVANGTYNESIVINQLDGSSSANTVTFQGNTSDSTKVILDTTWSLNTGVPAWTVHLNGADYITFANMTISHEASTSAIGANGFISTSAHNILLDGGSDNFTLTHCRILGPGLLSLYNGGVASFKDNDNNTTISNNYFHNCFYPVRLQGAPTAYIGAAESGAMIMNNTMDSINGNAGILVINENAPVIASNNLSSFLNDQLGGYIRSVFSVGNFGKVRIFDNKMNMNIGGEGVYTEFTGVSKPDSSIIYNNFITVHTNSRVDNFAIFSYADSQQYILHNNIHVVDADSNSYGIYMLSTSNINYIFNNVVFNEAGGYTVYLDNKPLICNFNDLYSLGNKFANLSGTSYPTMLKWRAATGFDNKSVNVDPIYKSVSDLHVKSPSLDGSGNVSKIVYDIDGDLRGSPPDMGADEFTPTGYDVAALGVSRPTGYCSGKYDIYALIRNTGSKKLTSCDVSLYVGGTLNKKVSVSGLSLNTGDTTSVKITNFSFSKGSVYTFMIIAENPDGNTDEDLTNDTAIRIMRPGISGTYTLGGVAADFPSFQSAVDSLTLNGICGSVLINVNNGTYYENITIGHVPGISPGSTVTFQGNTTDSTKVTLEYSSRAGTSAAPSYVLGFNKASYITFSHMTIAQLGTGDYNNTVNFNGGCNGITLSSNKIVSIGLRYQLSNGINSLQDADNDISIIGNYIYQGWAGILLIGNNTIAPDFGTVIKGNIIEGQHNYGVAVQYEDSLQIWGNKVHMTAGNVGIVQYYGVGSDSNYIANNFVSMEGDSGYGIFMYVSTNTNVYYNSVYNNSNVTGGYSFYALNATGSGASLQVFNNIFYSNNTALAIANASGISSSNFNDLYAPSGSVGYSGGFLSALSDWQTTTGFDANSISVDPQFKSTTDLHVVNTALNGAASPIAAVKTDIDGDKRDPSTPDIGADEFTPLAHDLALESIVNPFDGSCGDSNAVVSLKVINYGINTECSIPVYLRAVSGFTTTVGTYTFSLAGAACLAPGKDTILTIPASAFKMNTFAGVFIDTVVAAVTLGTDLNRSNDTIKLIGITTNAGSANPSTSTSVFICGSGSLKLTGTPGIATDTLFWYDALGNRVSGGRTFKTPTLSASTSYYLEESASKTDTAIGPQDYTIGVNAQASTFDVLYFQAKKTMTLDSLVIFSSASGSFDIQVVDTLTKKVVATGSYYSYGGGRQVIPVALNIPSSPHVYSIGFATTAISLSRNSYGAKYPYKSTAVDILGCSANSNYYFYFYDWSVTYPPACPSARVKINVSIGTGKRPTAKFSTSPSCAGSVSSVTNSSTVPGKLKTYTYDFGDGSALVSTTNSTAGHTYSTPGMYRVRMTVIDTGGCQDTLSEWLIVPSTATSKFSNTAGNVCQGGSIVMKDASVLPSGKTGTYEYKLVNSLGDTVNSSSSQNPSFTIDTPGRYRVIQSVSIAGACKDTSSIGVIIYDNPVVNFVIKNGCLKALAQLRDTSTVTFGTISQWSWDVGDGGPQVTTKDPTTTYKIAQQYTVDLAVTSSFGCSSKRKYVNITVTKDPDPTFSLYESGLNRTYTFTATEPNFTHTWNFGDTSAIDTGSPVQHQYAYSTNHSVTLTVTNSAGCSKTNTVGFITGISGAQENINNYFLTIYPNPFTDYTLVSYTLPVKGYVKIEFMDVLGRIVATPVSGLASAGDYKFKLNLNDYGKDAGIYILRMTVGDHVENKYLNFLK